MKNIKKILIVCTGNSCRSVMAEGYLTKRLKDMGISGISVISSGTAAVSGFNPTPETVQVVEEDGMDVSGYISLPLSKTHAENADTILIMEPAHKEKVLAIAPAAEKKIYFLREFATAKKDNLNFIEDPIGRSLDFYRKTYEIIKDSTEGFIEWLKN